MTENTEEAVAWRRRGKDLTWEYTTLDAPLISVVATDRQPLFPLSILETRDARIAELEGALTLISKAGPPYQTTGEAYTGVREEALAWAGSVARQALTGEA